jgi:hypothetical protein
MLLSFIFLISIVRTLRLAGWSLGNASKAKRWGSNASHWLKRFLTLLILFTIAIQYSHYPNPYIEAGYRLSG